MLGMTRCSPNCSRLLAPPGCLACRRGARAGGRAAVRGVHARAAVAAGRVPALRAADAPRRAAARRRARRSRARGRRSPTRASRGDSSRALKFRGALPAADVMAAHIAANLPAALRDPAVALVPVPAAPARRRARGFDPARVLTRRARAARSTGRSPTAWSAATARRARSAPAAASAARPAGSRSASAAHRRRARSSSTTSTRRARRSTPAPARSSRQGTTVVAAISYARTL